MNAIVEPLRLGWIEALVEGNDVFEYRYGRHVARGWEGFPDSLTFALEAARAHDADPWGPHLYFAGDGTLIGFGGFKGPPTVGEVEIGYAVAPAFQGKGTATSAALILIDRARTAGVTRVIAHTLAEESASTGVLVKCGFTMVTTTVDPDHPEEPPVWQWEKNIA